MLFKEKVSGAARHRPQLEKLIEHLRRDDVLVVTRLDRLARSTAQLLHIADKKAGLQSLDEPWADTTSPSSRMVMTVFAGIAEFERTLILSRTEEGRRAAQARGVAFGRPKKMPPDQQQLARDLVANGTSISTVARTFNVHPATIYRVLDRVTALCWFSVPLSRTGRNRHRRSYTTSEDMTDRLCPRDCRSWRKRLTERDSLLARILTVFSEKFMQALAQTLRQDNDAIQGYPRRV